MKKPISTERAQRDHGITTDHECMENGELRFRLIGNDGSSYSRTVASKDGAWQNSHSHAAFQELYLVEFGWMALATPARSAISPHIQILYPGNVCVTPVGQVHNVYLPGNAVIHTIRFGVRGPQPRWEPEPSFDLQTKCLSETEILSRATGPIPADY
jgi:mannose-6-phosphate isomerase-like protein (cupin superfamily)